MYGYVLLYSYVNYVYKTHYTVQIPKTTTVYDKKFSSSITTIAVLNHVT